MKKILFPIVMAIACFIVIAVSSVHHALAQAPDGYHCTGQPIGQLFVENYPEEPPYTFTTVYGMGAGKVSSFGSRGSVMYKIRPDQEWSYVENTPMISDSLTLTISGMTEVIWTGDPEFPQSVAAFYGTGIRYSGPTETESIIWLNATIDAGVPILKTSQISTTGRYSVFATIGDKIYGLRSGGGNYGYGVFFSIRENGTDYTELYHFHGEYERPDKLMLRYEFNENGTPDMSQPTEFWGISYAGGSHGKGALLELAIDGSSVYTRLDFTGQGGADNSWGPTDGEGPVALLQDIDTDGYVITRSGGAHNKGAVFLIGDDGNYKVHDFTAQYGTPGASAVVDRTSKKVFGVSGDEPGNDGLIYSFSLLSDFNFNEHLVNFNNSDYKNPISLAPSNGLLYVTVAENSSTGQGSLLSVNQDGSNLTHMTDFDDCFATVTNPPDGATNVSLTPTLRASRTSTYTTFQLSEEPDFSDDFISLSVNQEYEANVTTPLKPGTLYYARIDQDISFPGPITTFTTTTNNLVTYIIDPSSGETDISVAPLIKVAPIAGATSYTVEVSEHADFSSGVITKTSATPDLRITGPLKYSTLYYARAKSSASATYSYVTQFTTHSPEKYCFVSSPVHQAFQVATDNLKITANLVNGATTYTIELSTEPDFSNNSIIKTSAVSGQRTITFTGLSPYTVYYNRVKTNLSPEWGPRRWFTTAAEPSYLVTPSNGKTNVPVNPAVKVKEVAGAGVYTVEVSPSSGFGSGVLSFSSSSSTFAWYEVPLLAYSTMYYARVKTTYGAYGQVTTFTTHAPELYSFVSNPVDGATNVPYQGLKVTANQIIGSSEYTIELNTSPDFSGTSIVKTKLAPSRTIIFDLEPSTTYYNRTRTDFSDWGPVRSFTTAPVSAPPTFQEHVQNVSVYPNPFKSTFTISPQVDNEKTVVTLIDLAGRELYKREIAAGQRVELGDDLANGLYILKIQQGTTAQTHRMIKNR